VLSTIWDGRLCVFNIFDVTKKPQYSKMRNLKQRITEIEDETTEMTFKVTQGHRLWRLYSFGIQCVVHGIETEEYLYEYRINSSYVYTGVR